MDAKVTVESQISAVLSGELFNYGSAFEAIFETLLLAQMALAERDAQIKRAEALVATRDAQIVERELQIAETERMLREEWWLNHRCPISALYGDDGEMQCGASCCMKDFKRAPIGELSAHVCQRRLAWLSSDEAKHVTAELGLTEANNGD